MYIHMETYIYSTLSNPYRGNNTGTEYDTKCNRRQCMSTTCLFALCPIAYSKKSPLSLISRTRVRTSMYMSTFTNRHIFNLSCASTNHS